MKKIQISTEFIKLDQFLKFVDFTATGGQGKEFISSGQIKVNGEVEVRRGRKLRNNDIISMSGEEYQIVSDL